MVRFLISICVVFIFTMNCDAQLPPAPVAPDCLVPDGTISCQGAWPGPGESYNCSYTLCGATFPPTCLDRKTWKTNVPENIWNMAFAKLKQAGPNMQGVFYQVMTPDSCTSSNKCQNCKDLDARPGYAAGFYCVGSFMGDDKLPRWAVVRDINGDPLSCP